MSGYIIAYMNIRPEIVKQLVMPPIPTAKRPSSALAGIKHTKKTRSVSKLALQTVSESDEQVECPPDILESEKQVDASQRRGRKKLEPEALISTEASIAKCRSSRVQVATATLGQSSTTLATDLLKRRSKSIQPEASTTTGDFMDAATVDSIAGPIDHPTTSRQAEEGSIQRKSSSRSRSKSKHLDSSICPEVPAVKSSLASSSESTQHGSHNHPEATTFVDKQASAGAREISSGTITRPSSAVSDEKSGKEVQIDESGRTGAESDADGDDEQRDVFEVDEIVGYYYNPEVSPTSSSSLRGQAINQNRTINTSMKSFGKGMITSTTVGLRLAISREYQSLFTILC